jgi:steroid delta-isomerase-like uncharacterized protein
MASAKDIHRQVVDCWNKRDWGGMRALLHPDYQYRGGDGKSIAGGPDMGVEVARSYAAAFGDGRLEIQRVVAQGDVAVAEALAIGTHTGDLMGIPATGKRFTLPLCNVIELRDGRVYREHEYFDIHHLLVQLGLATPLVK